MTDQIGAIFQKTTLVNGLRVITEHVPAMRSISVGLWVGTGSLDESDKLAGVSHFIEHMLFKGTTTKNMVEIAEKMESVGGYTNAFTGKESTCYLVRSLDSHLDKAIDLVCDLVLNPVIDAGELEKEREVILDEMKMYEDSPDDLVFDYFDDVLYGKHALGRPVIGTKESVSNLTRDDLLNHMQAFYTPDKMVLAIAGNVNHEDAVRLAEKAFIKTKRKASSKIERLKPFTITPSVFSVKRPIQQAHLVLGRTTFSAMDDRRLPLTLLNTVLGSGMSCRLNQNIREKYGFCYNIYSFVNLYSDVGDFGIYMGTDKSRIEPAVELIFDELKKIIDEPLTEAQLKQAKNMLNGSVMLGLESMSNRMMRIGKTELVFNEYFELDKILSDLEKVTADDVHEIATALFQQEQFSQVTLIPED